MDEIPGAVGIDPEVVSFLNNRSHTAVRAWANPQTGLTAAVSVTEYPYDVFAAAALAATIDDAETEAAPSRAPRTSPTSTRSSGQARRRDERERPCAAGGSAIVLAQAGAGGLQEAAGAVVDLTRQLDGSFPPRPALRTGSRRRRPPSPAWP